MGNKNFWFVYIEEKMKTISLQTLDLIIAAYAKYFEVNRFVTFDKQLRKQVEKLFAK